MPFEGTATKKRPKCFEELIGQDFVVTTLKSSLGLKRIAHAYLFSGPRGVGKTSAARILAKSLNCEKGPTEIPCNKCSNCIEISQGNSLDVIEIDGASNTSVNDVREIKDEVLFSPNNSRFKIYIIDEVHMLSNSAFNALLKTIEEPPPYIVFIFATTEIHKVPATIKSRCQQFYFRLISTPDIKESLALVARESGLKADDDALFWIAKEATGSLRDAYTLFDQIVSFSGDEAITLDKIREKLGLVGLDRMNSLVELMINGKEREALESLDEILSTGVSVEQFIVDLTEYFRNLLFIKHGIRRESILGYAAERFLEKAVETFSTEQLEHSLELLLSLYRNIRFSLNQRYELELLISRLSSLHRYISQKELIEKIELLRNELMINKFPQPGYELNSQEENLEKANRTADREGLKKRAISIAREIISSVEKEKPSLASALEKASEWKMNEKDLLIFFQNAYSANLVREELSLITQRVEEIAGEKLKVSVRVHNRNVEDQNAERTNEQVEMVKKIFKGQVIQGEQHEY
ncbi:MAG: DNA polymerase III subunit gamma/tau [Spirochaetes bacterium]|nr:MAG: DNA polymerase III subunit gamma/tau [Spirochaetota bacterium]